MDELLDELDVLLRARYALLYLVTWEEQRMLRGLRTLAARLDRPLLRWSEVTGFQDTDDEALRGATTPTAALDAVRAWQGSGLFVLADFHPFLDDPAVVRRLRELAPECGRAGKAILLVGPLLHLPAELEKQVAVFQVPLPALKDVTRLLAVLLDSQKITVDLPLMERFVKASLGLTEQEIKQVYLRVLEGGGAFNEEDLAVVIQEKRKLIRRSRFLEFLPADLNIQHVGGLAQLKEWLADRAQGFSERARRFGLPQPKGLFLLGVQGCGKSLTAKAVAGLWHLPLLRLDMGALVSFDRHENGMADTIRVAESMAPVVLWVDEIEKAFAGVRDGNAEPGAVRAFGAFISWLQEKQAPVFVICTANQVQRLPPELLRKGRFDELFFVDLPNVHEREAILRIHLERRGRDAAAMNLWTIAEATENFSGAELEQVVVDGLFHAFRDRRDLALSDLLLAGRDTVPLARTMEEEVKSLREWARVRCRPATYDRRRIDFFEEWVAEGAVEMESGSDSEERLA